MCGGFARPTRMGGLPLNAPPRLLSWGFHIVAPQRQLLESVPPVEGFLNLPVSRQPWRAARVPIPRDGSVSDIFCFFSFFGVDLSILSFFTRFPPNYLLAKSITTSRHSKQKFNDPHTKPANPKTTPRTNKTALDTISFLLAFFHGVFWMGVARVVSRRQILTRAQSLNVHGHAAAAAAAADRHRQCRAPARA